MNEGHGIAWFMKQSISPPNQTKTDNFWNFTYFIKSVDKAKML